MRRACKTEWLAAVLSVLVACGPGAGGEIAPTSPPVATRADYQRAQEASLADQRAQVEATAPHREPTPAPIPVEPIFDTRPPPPPACIEAAAKVAYAKSVIDALAENNERLKYANDQIVELRASLAHEKANPSGVVDRRLLHDVGANLQAAQEAKAVLDPGVKEQAKEMVKAMAAAKKSAAACDAARGDAGSP